MYGLHTCIHSDLQPCTQIKKHIYIYIYIYIYVYGRTTTKIATHKLLALQKAALSMHYNHMEAFRSNQ